MEDPFLPLSYRRFDPSVQDRMVLYAVSRIIVVPLEPPQNKVVSGPGFLHNCSEDENERMED